MPARCPTGQSGPSKKEANYNENNSQIDSYLSTRCPDMCQKGSEGRGALLMEIQRRERVVLVAPAHGGQVGVYTLQLLVGAFSFFFIFSRCSWGKGWFFSFSFFAQPIWSGQFHFGSQLL